MGIFDGLLGLLSHDVGIDLGTANTLVTVRHRGIVISEPSVVAMDTRTRRVDAFDYEKPKTKPFAELLAKLQLTDKKVLVLTAGGENSYNVYLSGRNIPDVQVMRFVDATAYEILWSEAVVVELSAFEQGGAAAKEAEEEATDA